MSSSARAERWEQLRAASNVPVLIAGGGINGAGLLRELALNGVDAVLVEKGDFCSGASAASSRLIHGGLRYLEYGEFRLVRESLKERNRLLQAAPHYVHPLPTTIPIFEWSRGTLAVAAKLAGFSARPVRRGALLIKAGLLLYDWFTRRSRIMPGHRFVSRARTLQKHPGLNRRLVCSATYFDAWVSAPERLCLEIILEAELLGGRALNYVSASSAEQSGVILRDQLTQETMTVQPRIVVNATGAWIDFTNDALGVESQFIGGTKGSHLVLDHPALAAALAGEMIFFENDDGRICLLLPFQGKVIAGTTDIPVSNPDEAICDEAEAGYILESVARVFPEIAVSRSQIVFRYCGVRPLPRADAALPGEISRDHSCRVTEPNAARTFPVFSLVGGKWTTFRAFAEQAADAIMDRLRVTRRSSSAHLPIGGGRDFPQASESRAKWLNEARARTGLSQAILERLLGRYGTRAAQVAGFIAEEPDSELKNVSEFSRREIEFIADHEHVVRLSDLVLRRTSLALLGGLNDTGLRELAAIVGGIKGWDATRAAAEIQDVKDLLARKHGIRWLRGIEECPA